MHYYMLGMELELHAAGKCTAVFLQDGCAVLDVAFDVEPSTLTITAIKSAVPVRFECNGMRLTLPAGEDMADYLTPKQTQAIEAEVWKTMEMEAQP